MPAHQIMTDWEVWFYNKTAVTASTNKSESVKDIDRLSHILNVDYVVFYSAGHQWWEATYGFAKDALLQLCVSDSLFEAVVNDYTLRMRNYEGYANMTEEEVRNNMIWMLKNDPELIPGLDGENMPTLRNTKHIHEILTLKQIRNDKDWLSKLNVYATQHALQLDEVLQQEASHIARNEPLLREEIVIDTSAFIQAKKQQIMEQWRHNPEMIKMIEQKAKENNLPFEEMLEKDAQWVIDQHIEKGELFLFQ